MNDFYDALENCLQALEAGADLDSVLARYPHLADELRPILEASAAARRMAVPGPSADAVQRGRAKVLQRAAQLRQERTPAPRRVIPVFQRFSLAFSIAIIFLLSGTGLVRASSTALPGEGLYPVKRTLEGMRLFFVFDHGQRQALEGEYENERLDEIGELLSEGRHESIQFAGVVMDVNGAIYVSGIRIVILDTTQLPRDVLQNGSAVVVTGRTNAEGFVEAEAIASLPPGSVVPVGNPVVLEAENESSGSGSGGGGDTGGASGPQAGSDLKYFKIEGTVESVSGTVAVINGQTVYMDQAEIKGTIAVGVQVEVEGYFASDGRFIVTEIEVERPEPDRANENDNSNTNDDENGDDDDNENEDHDSDEDDDRSDNENDSSGSGGGDDDDD